MAINTREELTKKYVQLKPERHKDVYSIDEQIEFYNRNIDVLNILLNDLQQIIADNKYIDKSVKLTNRQLGCINRCIEEFNTRYELSDQNFSRAFYEITDFIFYPGCGLTNFTMKEIEISKMMASYLIYKANEIILDLL